MISVVVADDEALIRDSFRLLLEPEPGIDWVGEASNGREAVERVRQLRPDVILMDVRMPNVDGIEATRRLLALPEPPTAVVYANDRMAIAGLSAARPPA